MLHSRIMTHFLNIVIFIVSDMRCGLMYGGYGASGGAWWARHMGLLLPHSLLPPTRIPSQQTTPVTNCSPIHPEPLSPARPGSPRRCTPEKAKFGEIVFQVNLSTSIKYSYDQKNPSC